MRTRFLAVHCAAIATLAIGACKEDDEGRLSGWRNNGNATFQQQSTYNNSDNGQAQYGNGTAAGYDQMSAQQGGLRVDTIDTSKQGPETVFPETEFYAVGCMTHREDPDSLRQRGTVKISAGGVTTNITMMGSSSRDEVHDSVKGNVGIDVKDRLSIYETAQLRASGVDTRDVLVYTRTISNNRTKTHHTFDPPIPFIPRLFQKCADFVAANGYSLSSTVTLKETGERRAATMRYSAAHTGSGKCDVTLRLDINDGNGSFYEKLAIPAVQTFTYSESDKVYFNPTKTVSYYKEPKRGSKESSTMTVEICRVTGADGVLGGERTFPCEKPEPRCR